jgi:hypothetical protein
MFSFISDDFDENPSWHAECSAPLAVLAYQLGIDPYWLKEVAVATTRPITLPRTMKETLQA